ncbi:MAG: O-antigen ligase family protein [FCB group bacterium]|nr:O-antigen ligase family protein [FCB group bacterium]
MNSQIQNISLPKTVKWNLKHLLILVLMIPFIMIYHKLGYRESLAGIMFLFFLVLSVEAPRACIAIFFVLLTMDMNPSTYHYNPLSIFYIQINETLFYPLHMFYSFGILTGWFMRIAVIGEKPLKWSPLHLPLLLLILWMGLAQFRYALFEGEFIGAAARMKNAISMLLFFYFYRNIATEKQIRTIFYLLLLGLSLTFFVAYFRFFTEQYSQMGRRIFILWNEQVQMLHFFGLFALLAGFEKKIRFPLTAGIIVYAACIIQTVLSTSRATLMGSAVAILVVLLYRFKHKKIALIAVPFFVAVLAAGIFLIMSKFGGSGAEVAQLSASRLESMDIDNADLSVIFRFFSYQSAFQMALQNPILGISFNSGYYMNILGLNYYTTILDNTLLKLAMAAGFPAAILYIVCMFVLYRTAYKLLDRIPAGIQRVLLLSSVGVMAMANTIDNFHTNIAFLRVMPMVALCWAAIMKLNHFYPEKENNS